MTGTQSETGSTDTGDGAQQRFTEDDERNRLLGVLEDTHCRAIIEATGEKPRSARELAEQCDIALSTTYRKIRKLLEAELLEKRIRITGTHEHKHEYALRVDHIEIRVTPENGVELSVTWADEQSTRTDQSDYPTTNHSPDPTDARM